MKRRALYAGSFDPITLGHLDIIHKALMTFDEVVIGKGFNPEKPNGWFAPSLAAHLIAYAVQEKLDIHFKTEEHPTRVLGTIIQDGYDFRYANPIEFSDGPVNREKSFTSLCGRVHIGIYEDDTARYAERMDCTHLVRGLRQASDFDAEFQLYGAMRRITKHLIPVHIICENEFLHVSSSTVRQFTKLGYHDQLDDLVTPMVKRMLLGE